MVNGIRFFEPDDVLVLYAGIGIPLLRILQVGQANDFCPATYYQIKVANPLRGMVEPGRLRVHYESVRGNALASDPDAFNDLGWLWLNSSRIPFEPALARRLFKLTYVLGSAEAAFNLGEQAFYGKGVTVDRNLAISYYEQAYEGGVFCAARALGSLYCKSADDWTADLHKAVQWYMRATEDDDLDACFQLGCLVLDNYSPTHKLALGIYWLQWAAMT